MDYLALTQRSVREAGISGDGPTTVVGQVSMLEKMVGWVDQAWQDIQIMRPNWLFMNGEFTKDTVVGQRDYTAAGWGLNGVKLWDTGSFLIYEKAIGESDQSELGYYTYAAWRAKYRNRMGDRVDERPQVITIKPPSNSVRFEPRPDKIYTIDGEYKRSTQVFTANADVPTNLPDDFHIMIVWKALMYYADDQNAPDALDKAIAGFNPLLFRLENEQLAEFSEDYIALDNY